jgi:hypothetical protein
MTDRLRIRIAALVTASFIGGLSIAGVGLRHHSVAQRTGAAQALPATANVAPVGDDDEGGGSDAN